MAAKKSEAGQRRDRTKWTATPKRSDRRPAAAPRVTGIGVIRVLAGVAAILLGLVGAVRGVEGLAYQAGYTGGPRLAMTVDACQTTRHYRNAVTRCYGYGDPKDSGVVDEQWTIHNSEREYPAGSVLPVRCTRTGGCTELGIRPVAGTAIWLAFALLFLYGGVLGVLASLAEWLPGSRLAHALAESGRGRRTVTAGFVALGALLLAAVVTYAVT